MNYNFFSAFTQSKDVLIFQISKNENNSRHLLFSANPQFPYILLKNEFHRAKKNTVSFFQNIFPSPLKNILIGYFERTIKFVFDSFEVVMLIKGHETNIIILKNQVVVDSFKKINNKSEIELFISKISFYELDEINYDDLAEVDFTKTGNKKQFPFLSKLFFAEHESIHSKNGVVELINQILTANILVKFDKLLNRFIFIPSGLVISQPVNKKEMTFQFFNDAIYYYIKQTENDKKFINLKKKVEKYLDKNSSFCSEALNKLKYRIDNGEKANQYYKIGELLTSYFYLIKKDMIQLEVNDLEGNSWIIKLNRKLTPAGNIKYYFDKAKDEKNNYARSIDLFNQYLFKQKRMSELNKRFLEIDNHIELQSFIIETKMDKIFKENNQIISSKFKEFLLDGKYKVLVGKDSRNNDELTLHHANKNDYWFHARSVSGSHVVLRNDNQKDIIPKNILKSAASIAAYYSKAKTASLVPVSYTFAKYVVKRKGMDAGKVQISNEIVVIVKPEIPKNCVQSGVEDEIKIL